MEKLIQNAQQIKEIIAPIPANKFITGAYGDYQGNSCFLGHIHRKLSENPENYHGDFDGFGARQLTAKFLAEKHGYDPTEIDGADVNNDDKINGYNEPVIKDRLMHMLDDMIEAGY